MDGELVQMGHELPAAGLPVLGWDEMISTFLDTKKTSTRRTYGPKLRVMAVELGGCGPAVVTGQQLAAWGRTQWDQLDAGSVAPSTCRGRINAARSLFHFCRIVGQSPISKEVLAFVLPVPKDQVIRPFQVLSADEQGRILGAVEDQERRIVATMLYAGVRASELCKLRATDYHTDEQGRYWLKVRGKGGKSRVVPVGQALAGELGAPGQGDGPLFKSRQGPGHYKRQRIFQIVKAAVARAGIEKRISPHSLRHTAAITWLHAGVPLSVVQQWLGHASLATTQKYLDHVTNGEAHGYMP